MSTNNSPKLIAHRGCSQENPQNTIKAFKAAYTEESIKGIELDVRETLDGVLVVYHDKNLKSLTDKEGVISKTHSSKVLSAEVLNSGERIPTLEQVLQTTPKNMEIIIEVKQPGIEDKVAEKASNLDQKVTVYTFNMSGLQKLSKHSLRTGYLFKERKINRIFRNLPLNLPNRFYFRQNIEKHIEKASKLGCNVLQCRLELAKRTDIVSEAKKEGLEVDVWTMKKRSQYCQLKETRVDSIITDIYDKPTNC